YVGAIHVDTSCVDEGDLVELGVGFFEAGEDRGGFMKRLICACVQPAFSAARTARRSCLVLSLSCSSRSIRSATIIARSLTACMRSSLTLRASFSTACSAALISFVGVSI